ncbi:MAG: calcium/sodium antiporter [Ruminococcaceae bacterium]|nr:calcium/sodium antiporter [Oscillospiraceae bacterium]
MEYVLNLAMLLVGFFFLVKGADIFVDGSSSVAKLFKIPSVIIGLTIVSIGTSLPEAAVSITSSLQGSYDLSIANVVGSNIFNLLVVVGASALICPFVVDKMIMKRDLPICIGITALLAFMLRDNILSRIEAGVLFVIFVAYLVLLVVSALKDRQQSAENEKPMPLSKSLVFILLGGAGIILGGTFTVDSAKFFAKAFGMSEMLIGLTVVAVGTSLPELVTSIVAAKKGESEIALGNVVGSCIFNIMFILGMSGLVHPLNCEPAAFIDSVFLIGVNILMYLACITSKKVNRPEGLICVVLYVIYIAYTILRAFSLLPF